MAKNNYIKIPNQGNITSNLHLLSEMKNSEGYADKHGYFTKSQVAEIAANALIITSSSKIGEGVIDRINNSEVDEGNNSPLQNAKMRMQIMRTLGLVSTDYDSEVYAITELGDLILADSVTTEQRQSLVRELFMSVCSSSESYDFTCSEGFHCYLGLEICYALACLDYKIGVKELPIITTYDYREINKFVEIIKKLRESGSEFPKDDLHFPHTNGGHALKDYTNLTRTPVQILRYCGILEHRSRIEKGKRTAFYHCTEYGKAYVDQVKDVFDCGKLILLSPYEFRKMNVFRKKELCRIGHENILIKAGLITKKNSGLVFSPYQMLAETTVSWLLGNNLRPHPEKSDNKVQAINSMLTSQHLRLKALFKHTDNSSTIDSVSLNDIAKEMLLCKGEEQRKKYVEKQLEQHRNDDWQLFYPYIHSLFNILGLDCHGVGRYDGYTTYKQHAIPIEIKSPKEELSYHQKGIRQAIENKICSYNAKLADDMEYSTLVVGYTHPVNDKNIHTLIERSFEKLKIRVIAFDLAGLLNICLKVVCDNMQLDFDELLRSHGIIIEE